MSRALTSAMQAALAAGTGEGCYLFALEFSTGTVYLTTAATNIVWGGHTFVAVGGAISFDGLAESGDLSGSGFRFLASGVDQGLIADILTVRFAGRNITLWYAMFDASSAIIADPAELFVGWMNGGWTIAEERDPGGNGGTVTMEGSCTGRIDQLDQSRGIQANLGSHQALYPGDEFFRWAGAAVGNSFVWSPEKPV